MAYEVMTQAMSSIEAPRFPAIWFSATFTIEVSISSMMAAEIVVIAIKILAVLLITSICLLYGN